MVNCDVSPYQPEDLSLRASLSENQLICGRQIVVLYASSVNDTFNVDPDHASVYLDYHIQNSTPSNPYQCTHALSLNRPFKIAELWQNVPLVSIIAQI